MRPVLNPAVEVSSGEVAKVNVGKGSKSGEIWAYNGSVTAVPNEIKMLRYNLVIVEVPRRGGWIPGAQIVRKHHPPPCSTVQREDLTVANKFHNPPYNLGFVPWEMGTIRGPW